MKKTSVLSIALVSLLLAAAGCKKKPSGDQGASKATEGSAVAPAAGGSAETPAPAAAAPGSAAPAANAPAAPAGEPAKAEAVATKPLLETAQSVGSLTTFLKAVDAAGLTANLGGAGPFTVFAPTDEAFAKLPPKQLQALLADKAKLAALLQYHVVAGTVLAKDLAAVKAEKTIQGAELPVDATSGVKIGGATVVKADIVASNGVIHTIDTVLTPPAK